MNGERILAHAARTLREHTDAGWVALREDVVAAAVSAFRPSAPVRGRLPGGELWVASTVLVSRVREAVVQVAGGGPLRITCTTTAGDDLDRVTIELIALYGTPLVPLADEVRRVAADAVSATLGTGPAPIDRVLVDISVGDVTADPLHL